jgi:hypothetical protein
VRDLHREASPSPESVLRTVDQGHLLASYVVSLADAPQLRHLLANSRDAGTRKCASSDSRSSQRSKKTGASRRSRRWRRHARDSPARRATARRARGETAQLIYAVQASLNGTGD